MNAHCNEIEARRHALAISIGENEGGMSAAGPMGHQCGRPIETDRSWAVYHGSTGAPVRVDGNPRNTERWAKRVSLSAPARSALCEKEAR